MSDFVAIALSGRHGKGRFALVDAHFARVVSTHSWHLTPHGYAAYTERCSSSGSTTYVTRRLHRLIAHLAHGIPMTGREIQVDHANRDKLDNRSANLRLTDFTGNNANRELLASNTSGRKGVSWDKESGRWKASIRYQRRLITLGRFIDLDEAARAYDAKARELFGELAVLNFKDGV